MERLAHNDFLYLLLQLSLMIVCARVFGEIFKRMRQPAVVGEIVGGIILGPSVFASFFPGLFNSLFLAHPKASIAMDGIYYISLVMMLFISGMEIELPLIWRNGRSALIISFTGMIIPLLLGWGIGWYFHSFFTDGTGTEGQRLAFSLFFGTALAITALPVIAKILLDLNLLNTKIGGIIIACAMMNDFVGWILFSIVLSLMPGTTLNEGTTGVGQTVVLTVLFAIITLTLLKFVLNRLFAFLNRRFQGPGGSLTIAMMMCFAGAVFTEYIGIHAVFGAFLMGIAFGESINFSERSREIIHQFVANVFAPLFFVSIGLHVDFVRNFDWAVILVILIIAFISKIIGGYAGGKLGGLSTRESLAIGFGINARGAMEIILGIVALQNKLISERIFVALTIMAILTSISSGSLIRLFLRERQEAIEKE